MAVLPGVLGCPFDFAQDRRLLRRTVQVHLGTNTLRHAHLRGLATAIHNISGLEVVFLMVVGDGE
jgi:hypothetical protein